MRLRYPAVTSGAGRNWRYRTAWFLAVFQYGAMSAFAVFLIRTEGWIDWPYPSMQLSTAKCEQTFTVLLRFNQPNQTVDARD
ncbi:MAG: hypothetical protein HC814_00620 [Rhodobacteraceae bacterium]|nr:hypothetical protein [Paracoccaceae bacterium]